LDGYVKIIPEPSEIVNGAKRNNVALLRYFFTLVYLQKVA